MSSISISALSGSWVEITAQEGKLDETCVPQLDRNRQISSNLTTASISKHIFRDQKLIDVFYQDSTLLHCTSTTTAGVAYPYYPGKG